MTAGDPCGDLEAKIWTLRIRPQGTSCSRLCRRFSPCHQVCHRTVPCWGPAPGGSREHRGGRWELLRARPGDTGDVLTGSGLIDGKVPVTAPLGLSPDGFKVLQSQASPLCSQNAQGESSDKWQKN